MQKARQNVGPFTFYRETDSQHRQSLRRLTDRKEKGRDKTRNETVPGPEGNGTSSTKNFITALFTLEFLLVLGADGVERLLRLRPARGPVRGPGASPVVTCRFRGPLPARLAP